MAERPTVTQSVQFGKETTPGTAVAANILARSFSINPGVNVDMQRFRPTGAKLEQIITPGKEWVEFDIEGAGNYQELHYLLSMIANAPAAPTVDTSPAYLWTFTLQDRTPDSYVTYSFEQGDANFAHKFAFGLLTELTLGLSRDGVEVGGSGMARALTTGATMTASPVAADPIVPMLPTELDVYLDPTFGAIGTTRLGRAFSAELTIGDRFGPVWVLNSSQSSYSAVIETAPTVEVEVLVEADADHVAALAQMRAGSTKFLRLRSTSTALAATAKPYQFTVDLPVKIADVSDFDDEDGVYALSYTFAAVGDSNLAPTFVVRNIQDTYAP